MVRKSPSRLDQPAAAHDPATHRLFIANVRDSTVINIRGFPSGPVFGTVPPLIDRFSAEPKSHHTTHHGVAASRQECNTYSLASRSAVARAVTVTVSFFALSMKVPLSFVVISLDAAGSKVKANRRTTTAKVRIISAIANCCP